VRVVLDTAKLNAYGLSPVSIVERSTSTVSPGFASGSQLKVASC